MSFAQTGTFDDYCQTIDNFIGKSTSAKRLLGFLIHDQNCDQKIDLSDIQESIRNLTSKDHSID